MTEKSVHVVFGAGQVGRAVANRLAESASDNAANTSKSLPDRAVRHPLAAPEAAKNY